MAANSWRTEAAWAFTRLPLEEASSLPGETYSSREFFDLERDRVFGTSWVAVALADEVTTGRLLVRSIGGKSILVTRNRAGELRSFLNSCRHRGTELAVDDCDVADTIRCPYHRWGYTLDGALVATPRFEDVAIENFDRDDFGLHPIRVQAWGCLIFACLDPSTAPLEDWLGDLPDRTRGYALHTWRVHDSQTVTVKANWKLIAENFQEYYHLTWIHPELARVSRVEDHYRFQGPGMYCGQTTTPVSTNDRDDWSTLPPAPDLNASDAASGRFISLFPNVLLSILPNHAFVMILEPVTPGRTIETCAWLVPPGSGDISEDAFATTRSFWLDVNTEDIDIVERGQRGIDRGGFESGRLAPRFEEPLHRFQNMIANRFIGLDTIPAGDPNDSEPRLGTGENPLPYVGRLI